MPITFKGNESYRLSPVNFADENELQEILAENPYLLMDDSEPAVFLVNRETAIGNSGYLDILLIDIEGKPTAVEVKLGKNTEARRQVVGQVFDYVSALSLYTVDELDQLVNGKLENALRMSSPEMPDADFKKIWQRLGSNLRAGEVRVVVAVDSAPENLVRIIRFVNDHSDLDVRLVSIQKYLTPHEEIILVPNLIVYGGGRQKVRDNAAREPFQHVLQAYSIIAAPGFETRGRGGKYRLIYPAHWPWQVHYEFYDYGDKISADLHLEGDNVTCLTSSVKAFELQLKDLFPNAEVRWDPTHSKNRGALSIIFNPLTSPDIIAAAMKILIDTTYQVLDEELCKQGLLLTD